MAIQLNYKYLGKNNIGSNCESTIFKENAFKTSWGHCHLSQLYTDKGVSLQCPQVVLVYLLLPAHLSILSATKNLPFLRPAPYRLSTILCFSFFQ